MTIDVLELRRLKAVSTEVALRPPVKPSPLRRNDGKEQATQAFRLATDELLRRGWSLRAIARAMGCSAPHVHEMRAGTRRVGDWAWKLPGVARALYSRELFNSVDETELEREPPSATGTEGR